MCNWIARAVSVSDWVVISSGEMKMGKKLNAKNGDER